MVDRQRVYLIASNAEAGTLESLSITAHLEIINLTFRIYFLKETNQNILALLEIEFDDFFELI